MKIAGIEKCSCVDWPGRISAVLFTPGCNFNCYYCHNRPILGDAALLGLLTPDSAIELVARRREFIDGVVISGGEPTLQSGLREFISDIRSLGFPVKLDTNGSRPNVLRNLIEDGLLDYVAMDVKAPFGRLNTFCCASVDAMAIASSIELLLDGRVDYEFRTTATPQLSKDDVVQIAHWIEGAKRYVLQQYRMPNTTSSGSGSTWEDEIVDRRLTAAPHDAAWFASTIREISDLVEHCETRGLGEVATAARRVA